MVSVPVGVAVVYGKMPPRTIGNVFYELGMMQALGKETVIINVDGTALPSDVSGTEYIRFDDRFKQNSSSLWTACGRGPVFTLPVPRTWNETPCWPSITTGERTC